MAAYRRRRKHTRGGRAIPGSGNARRQSPCNATDVSLRCLIVDDSKPFLDAARALLEREDLIVAVAGTGGEALRNAETLRPDVVLVDIFLGEESGLDLAEQLVEGPANGATVILISTHTEADLADLVAASPAAGFLPKAELSAVAIRRIVEGRSG